MTYRERREARAEQLTTWADKRKQDAARVLASQPELRHDIAFITQPGHIAERDRMNRRDERAFESIRKANTMTARAYGIRDQLDRSIYSDDPDAVGRLEERIAALEQKQAAYKAANAAFRKEHRAELASMSAYQRGIAAPHQPYEMSNLSAEIRRNRQRLESIRAASAAEAEGRPARVIRAMRGGTCHRCGHAIEVGGLIGKYADGWAHTYNAGDGWERCSTDDERED